MNIFRTLHHRTAPFSGLLRKHRDAVRLGFSHGVPRSFTARHQRGFTLVTTVILVGLLVILSIGMLGLSTITLRGGAQAMYAAQARGNARLALMLAIGELQKNAGLDTRVTARADVLDEKNPPVMGVWKSWEGADHTTSSTNAGRPVSPGDYATKKTDRFLRWMVSGDDPQTLPKTTEESGTVPLVGAKTVGSQDAAKYEVHLNPTLIETASNHGAFAWWVGGENQKARLPKPYEPTQSNNGRWAIAAKSHAVADPSSFRMDSLLSDNSSSLKVVSLSQSDFIGTKKSMNVSQEFFYDLSTTSVGLLTNTATGGWRKDMSLLTENWSTIPTSNLPFFRVSPDKDIAYTKPSAGNPTPAKAMLYPWCNYRGSAGNMAIYRQGAVASWENLKEYALMYRNSNMTTSSSGTNRIKPFSVAIDGDAYSFIHRVRVLPVIARIQWVLSYMAGPGAGGKLEPRVVVNPVITMWNPYNVELNMPRSGTGPTLVFSIPKPLPVALRFSADGKPVTDYKSLTAGALDYPASFSGSTTLTYNLMDSLVLKPGETRVFSAQNNTAVPAGTALNLMAGYRSQGGHYFSVLPAAANGAPGTLDASAKIKADAKFDVTYDDGTPGVGIYLDMLIDGTNRLAYRMTFTREMAGLVYQDLPNLQEVSLATVTTTSKPFLSSIFGARTASRTMLPTKGFVQSSPLVNYTAMGSKDTVETTIAKHYLGTRHPANSPFDYSFVEHSSGGDALLPNASDTSQRGYIVSGFSKSDGLTRCVIAELPTRPLQSLCELQNWDMRYENPVPPYAFNLIGNSDASPLIPSNAVVDVSNQNSSVNLQHDDSYCANHLLFDDWFLSSISPDPDSFGTSGRDMKTTFMDFLSGKQDLGNRAYRPIPEDARADEGVAAGIYNDHVKTVDGWKNIASRLEVEGMFNVNSTSVTAWRALLGHARNQCVPYYKEASSSWSIGLSGKVDHPVSRFSLAGDVEAGQSGSSGDFADASQFTGYRVLDDKLLDDLADKIVKQVRLRGPFLSLSEFVNRQLSTGDLALAGAVQTALNQISQSGSTNPFSYLQGASTSCSPASMVKAADAEYKFVQAADGKSSYGLPGWTRQADVLRPLAPILSARDDTFVIRTHGDARDSDGKVMSTATCEAIVRRTRDYVDPKDAADLATPPVADLNKSFGRHFEVVSFRWLLPSEI